MKGGNGTVVAVGLVALAVLQAWPVSAQHPGSALVVRAEWLADHLDDPDVVVLQVGPEEIYTREHVPGSRFVSLDMIRAPMPDDGDHANHLALELPPAETLRLTLQDLGVSDQSLVVVVPSEAWLTPSARVVFTLDYMGLGDRTRFLDGGLEAWKAAGHPVSATVPSATPGHLTTGPVTRVVSHEWVAEHATEAGYALLDARAPAFFDGLRDDRGKMGHIPGAASLPWTELVIDAESEGKPVFLRPPEEIRDLFHRAGVEDGDTVVAYCHIGQYGTMVLLAARMLGHEVRLYDGSMNEWAMLDLPVEGR
ncbi:MAG: rhodanese-like domain-containing protein [Gemmatimonadota bacterium]